MKVILASASPRRKELLWQIGWNFEVCVSKTGEDTCKRDPKALVEELSARKAKDVFGRREETEEEILVIGADTVVSCDGEIFGKPSSKEDAARMLEKLQGNTHRVYTGVTLCLRWKGVEPVVRTFHEVTEVDFYPMTEEEIQSYIETENVLDKAGAYAIQGVCARHIRGIRGDYGNVVGLPVGRLYQEVKELFARNGVKGSLVRNGGRFEESSDI